MEILLDSLFVSVTHGAVVHLSVTEAANSSRGQ